MAMLILHLPFAVLSLKENLRSLALSLKSQNYFALLSYMYSFIEESINVNYIFPFAVIVVLFVT